MRLIVNPPTKLDASVNHINNETGETEFDLKFYKGRKYAYGSLLESYTEDGTLLDRSLVRISKDGRFSLERLFETEDLEAPSE